MALFPPPREAGIEFASDASGNWGSGVWCQDKWWQCQLGIAFKELFAVVLSAAVWGREWKGSKVLGHCDNEVVTLADLAGILSSCTSSGACSL